MQNIQKIFASICRIKILKTLASEGETNIMSLSAAPTAPGLKLTEISSSLKNAGIVESRFLQNQRLIKLKQKSAKVEAVLKALRILEIANLTQSILWSNVTIFLVVFLMHEVLLGS